LKECKEEEEEEEELEGTEDPEAFKEFRRFWCAQESPRNDDDDNDDAMILPPWYSRPSERAILCAEVWPSNSFLSTPKEKREKKKREKTQRGTFFAKTFQRGTFYSPNFVRRRWRPQIHVRMQDNDNNGNKHVTLEGLAKLCEADPFQCAIMCRNVDEMGVVEILNL
jgi:hypothetical protein